MSSTMRALPGSAFLTTVKKYPASTSAANAAQSDRYGTASNIAPSGGGAGKDAEVDREPAPGGSGRCVHLSDEHLSGDSTAERPIVTIDAEHEGAVERVLLLDLDPDTRADAEAVEERDDR